MSPRGTLRKQVSSALYPRERRIMSKVDENNKSVRFTAASDERLTNLSLKLGRTKRQLIVEMVDYFYKSKKDPADLNDEVLKKELARGINRIISFFRIQETEFHIPILSISGEIAKATQSMQEGIKKSLDQQTGIRATVSQNLARQKVIEDLLEKVLMGLVGKEELKSAFRKIMEDYIAQRETIGWATSSTKKDELVKRVRAAVDKL